MHLRRAAVAVIARTFLLCTFSGKLLRADETKEKSKQKDSDEKVYEIGGDVQAPKLVHMVEPEFDPKSEEAFTSGVVKIKIVITAEGSVKDPRILSGLNTAQDKKAIDAVKKWRFKPGTLKDKPVSVNATVEVNFHLL